MGHTTCAPKVLPSTAHADGFRMHAHVLEHPPSDFPLCFGGCFDGCFARFDSAQVGQEAFERTGGAVEELGGHTDTVSSLAFNADGSLLATGGMDGEAAAAGVPLLHRTTPRLCLK